MIVRANSSRNEAFRILRLTEAEAEPSSASKTSAFSAKMSGVEADKGSSAVRYTNVVSDSDPLRSPGLGASVFDRGSGVRVAFAPPGSGKLAREVIEAIAQKGVRVGADEVGETLGREGLEYVSRETAEALLYKSLNKMIIEVPQQAAERLAVGSLDDIRLTVRLIMDMPIKTAVGTATLGQVAQLAGLSSGAVASNIATGLARRAQIEDAKAQQGPLHHIVNVASEVFLDFVGNSPTSDSSEIHARRQKLMPGVQQAVDEAMREARSAPKASQVAKEPLGPADVRAVLPDATTARLPGMPDGTLKTASAQDVQQAITILNEFGARLLGGQTLSRREINAAIDAHNRLIEIGRAEGRDLLGESGGRMAGYVDLATTRVQAQETAQTQKTDNLSAGIEEASRAVQSFVAAYDRAKGQGVFPLAQLEGLNAPIQHLKHHNAITARSLADLEERLDIALAFTKADTAHAEALSRSVRDNKSGNAVSLTAKVRGTLNMPLRGGQTLSVPAPVSKTWANLPPQKAVDILNELGAKGDLTQDTGKILAQNGLSVEGLQRRAAALDTAETDLNGPPKTAKRVEPQPPLSPETKARPETDLSVREDQVERMKKASEEADKALARIQKERSKPFGDAEGAIARERQNLSLDARTLLDATLAKEKIGRPNPLSRNMQPVTQESDQSEKGERNTAVRQNLGLRESTGPDPEGEPVAQPDAYLEPDTAQRWPTPERTDNRQGRPRSGLSNQFNPATSLSPEAERLALQYAAQRFKSGETSSEVVEALTQRFDLSSDEASRLVEGIHAETLVDRMDDNPIQADRIKAQGFWNYAADQTVRVSIDRNTPAVVKDWIKDTFSVGDADADRIFTDARKRLLARDGEVRDILSAVAEQGHVTEAQALELRSLFDLLPRGMSSTARRLASAMDAAGSESGDRTVVQSSPPAARRELNFILRHIVGASDEQPAVTEIDKIYQRLRVRTGANSRPPVRVAVVDAFHYTRGPSSITAPHPKPGAMVSSEHGNGVSSVVAGSSTGVQTVPITFAASPKALVEALAQAYEDGVRIVNLSVVLNAQNGLELKNFVESHPDMLFVLAAANRTRQFQEPDNRDKRSARRRTVEIDNHLTSFPNVILVSATNHKGEPDKDLFTYSQEYQEFDTRGNRSSGVDILAPGKDVPAEYSNGLHDRSNGTSFAAPKVAQAAAHIQSLAPKLTPVEIKAVLSATADNPSTAPLGLCRQYGGFAQAGLLNTDRANRLAAVIGEMYGTGITIDVAMDRLNIPETDRKKLRSDLAGWLALTL